MTSPQTTRGAHSLHGDDDGGGKRKRPAWLWLLLPLLALLALGAFLIAQNAGDDGDDEGIDATDESSDDTNGDDGSTTVSSPTSGDAGTATSGDTGAGSTDSATGPSTSADGTGTAQSTENEGGSAGTGTTVAPGGGQAGTAGQSGQIVTTDDARPVLPVPASGLAELSGTEVEATSVAVESVVADEGFWVGSSATDRVFVRLRTTGESPQQVRAGDTVSFTGTVAPVPADVEGELGVEAGEGADQLTEQGQLIEVSTVEQG